MPTFISKDGVQTPALEKVVLRDKNGDPHIYEGPDRAATNYMKENGLNPKTDTLGMHFSEDPDIINRAHERKQTIDEFCKTNVPGNTAEDRKKKFEENAKKVNNHSLPKRNSYKGKGQTGGANFAGPSGNLKGGYGEGDPLSDAKSSVKGA